MTDPTRAAALDEYYVARHSKDAERLAVAEAAIWAVALHIASKSIRALPKVHGPGIAISDEALSEREAIADFLDELSS